MDKQELLENHANIGKSIKSLFKDNKELTDLVCYMRKLLDECLHESDEGDLVPLTNDNKKLNRAFEIMMLVQHEKDLKKEEKQQNVKLQQQQQQQQLGEF